MTQERGLREAFDFVVDVLEGGDRVVEDVGGVTKYGISQRAHPTINVRELSRNKAMDILYEEYWKPAGCDMLAWPLCLVVFDAAVNHGVSAAVQMRLRAYNWAELLMERLVRYKHLRDTRPDDKSYFIGWMERLSMLYQKAKG